MIELQLTTQVTQALPRALTSINPARGWGWSGHQFSIAGRDCLLLLEHQSLYVMLFVGLSASDYAAFQQVWQRRLLAEMLTVAELDPLQSSSLQIAVLEHSDALLLSDAQHLDEHPHLAKAVQGVKLLATRYGHLPNNESEEFRWGVILNQACGYQGTTPYLQFAKYCQKLIPESFEESMPVRTVWH
ncbi:DUF6933 domain-containing protein [Celerinatantimonas yamalensis]|uniref:DUF6933 domain-containing protein n=1 Tax=Celerinatantimonas yamalensis TaxID=559956 RepID=A0ABW9GA10_9GAMM